jgi:RimJ/RimL family protein N-acetyltransferase
MSDASLPALAGKRITRRPREEDFEARLRLGNNAEIFRVYGGNRGDLRPMTEETAKQWMGRLLGHDYAWIIEVGALIGNVRLDRVDLRDKAGSGGV